jgi:phosphoglycolate phosphatase
MTKKLAKKKSVVVFDFDGTIVDSMGKFAEIASHVMPRHYNVNSEEAERLYLSTSGIPFFQQLETIFPGNPVNPTAANEFETIKKESYFTERVFEDVAPTIEKLKKKNITVVVSSNNFQELVDRFVEKRGLKFDLVLGFKDNFAKGADHFRHIIKETGCSSDEIVFVGDSLKDADRARDFGIEFVGKEGIFTKDQFKKHLPRTKVIKSLSELPGIIR